MCGILAALGLSGDPEASRRRVLKASRLLRHRGPDATGVYANATGTVVLTHERLNIIDPSDAGKQPFIIDRPEGEISWIINSEIYNHVEVVKTALAGCDTSWTTSDSVILGYLYQKFGPVPEIFQKLDGIFCGVLYDDYADQFLAFRDPIGVCPMYWGRDGDGAVWFASEMKALQHCVELDVFPPGHMYWSGTKTLERWYNPSWLDMEVVPTQPTDLKRVKKLVIDAVKKRLMSDAPLAVLLSGGLDSSLVASIVARHMHESTNAYKKNEKVHTFSIGVKGAPDLVAARKVADFLGTIHHECHMTVEEGIDALRDLVYHTESYHQARASVPNYLLARRIKAQGFKVVLSGEGADEALGGYLYFHKAPSAREFHKETVRKVTRLHKWDVLRANKSSFAWGLEVRVPFLDKDFLQYVMSVDPQDKVCDMSLKPDGVHPKMEKYILRKAFDDATAPYLPDSVLFRQKEQFSDGVGYSWVDGLKTYAEKVVTDEAWEQRYSRFPDDPPRSREYYLLQSLFEELFPNPCAAATVPKGLSIACSTPEAVAWDPSWADLHEISGRAIDVHDAAGSFRTAQENGFVPT